MKNCQTKKTESREKEKEVQKITFQALLSIRSQRTQTERRPQPKKTQKDSHLSLIKGLKQEEESKKSFQTLKNF